MFVRGLPRTALLALGWMSILVGCRSDPRAGTDPETNLKTKGNPNVAIHYVEIVSDDMDTLAALYERVHGLSFGAPDPDLGQARVATRADGSLVGIRKPLAAHEQPIVRNYLEVEDIQQAVKKAEENGAFTAYPPTRQGQRGVFAIVIQGNVQHGLWQR